MKDIDLFNDSFQNFKGYQIPKAQLILSDPPYQLGSNAYASNPKWYNDGDNSKGESEYALSHQWISVDEAFPEANENVLALIGGVLVVAKGYHVRARLRDITHWMPIPKFEPNKTE